MIAYIRGILSSIDAGSVVVEASGVGYEMICPNPYVFQDMMEEEVKIYTYHYVREDAQTLYGFKKVEEKALFAKLLNVSGIGPKGALAIVASTGAGDVAAAIEREDDKFLTRFPGVGKKTARQMILDLKGKLGDWLPLEESQDSLFYKESEQTKQSKALEEALEALRALGYSEREIKKILPDMKKEALTDVDGYVRKGLALMMKK